MPLDVLNPFDQSLVCSLDYDEGAALEAKIATAHSAAEGWRQVPLQERIEQVRPVSYTHLPLPTNREV